MATRKPRITRKKIEKAINERLCSFYTQVKSSTGTLYIKESGLVFFVTCIPRTTMQGDFVVEYASCMDAAELNYFEKGDVFYWNQYANAEDMVPDILQKIAHATADGMRKMKCPCCKKSFLNEYETCHICSWIHDPKQLSDPDLETGENSISLREATYRWETDDTRSDCGRRIEGNMRKLRYYQGCKVIIEARNNHTAWGNVTAYQSETESEDGQEHLTILDEQTYSYLDYSKDEILAIMEIFP